MTELPRLLAGLLAAVTLAIPCAAQSAVAYVLEQNGVWILNGSSAVKNGQRLPAGSSIRRRSSSSEDYITFADTGMRLIPAASRKCSIQDCSRPIVLTKQTDQRSYLRRGYDALMATIFRTSESTDANLNRGGGLAEGVIAVKDGRADLAPILTAEGEQFLRWRTVTLEKAGEWSQPVKLGRAPLVSGLSSGLYEFNLMRSNGGHFEPVGSAWVLAVPSSACEKTAAAFDEARRLAEQWGDQVKPRTKRLFLRASLRELSNEPPE